MECIFEKVRIKMNKQMQLFFVCVFFVLIIMACSSNETPSQRILKNENVTYAKVLDSKLDVFSDNYDIEIHTKSGYKIVLHKVKRSLNNKGICISYINDIGCYGGKTYEILEQARLFYDPRDIEVLGKMLCKKMQTVDDVINNIEELYDLYKIFEAHSREEFIYGDRFLIKADFKKLGLN